MNALILLLSVALANATSSAPAGPEDVTFNEIMYHPADEGSTSGDDYEFLELKNAGSQAVDLSGFYFGEGIQYVFPGGSTLDPGQIIVLASIPVQFEARYGFAPYGGYSGKLDNSGETVALLTPQGSTLLEVTYDDDAPWPVAADGSGLSLVPLNREANPDPNNAASWRLSRAIGGSPGTDDPPGSPAPSVVVNELLAHTDPPQQDAVELHNLSDRTVSVSGWYLTDDPGEPTKYRIPAGITIPPGGYHVLDEEDFNTGAHGFAFSESGEDVLLFATDETGSIDGTVHGFRFAASENQVSFGRHLNSLGEEHFVRQRALTFGQANAGPRPSPVVISEMMYRPADGRAEFVELVNVSDGMIPLYDPARPLNTWRIDGIGYSLPVGIDMAPGEVLLVVPTNTETFRTQYGLSPNVRILGPYGGALSNGGERIILQQPGPPDDDGMVPYISMEIIDYRDDPPWPVQPDGDGPSLERIDLLTYANDPMNWRASAASGGTPGDAVITSSDRPVPVAGNVSEILSVYPNPLEGVGTIVFQAGAGESVRIVIYDVLGRVVRVLHEGTEPSGAPREVTFDARALPSGTYTIRIEGNSQSEVRHVVLVR